jgi:hypothetical protein
VSDRRCQGTGDKERTLVSRAFVRIAAARVASTSPKQTEEQQRDVQAGEVRQSQAGNLLLELQRVRGNHYVQQLVMRELQRGRGNRYVQQLADRAGPPIQAKLRLGRVGDHYEQEADRVARTAAHELIWHAREAGGCAHAIRHRPGAGGGDVDAGVRAAVERARGAGRPLEDVTSRFPDRCFALDQFGPLSIRPCHGASWARRKQPARLSQGRGDDTWT